MLSLRVPVPTGVVNRNTERGRIFPRMAGNWVNLKALTPYAIGNDP
jgi:hypothetical protein